MADKLEFVYVVYIESAPEKIWTALTDPGQTAAYWGHSNVSDWQVGSQWEHQRTDGSRVAEVVGTVVESAPPTRLVTTWAEPGTGQEAEPSRVTFDIAPYGEIVRLTVTHQDLAGEAERDAVAGGWPAVLSNLKTFIETGRPLPQEPWTMP
ncbi:SRPBCC family protein [Streptomyces varsoviensis]|uniref:GntR family transcriptional regulator n=1 Tax=Streptomyces varsoviensis TaxID=67373 RepID=A0ABR5J7E0_9ACTN|nr:SRPBCC family protein [Streptomyces varsoviensis]KOG89263.1 GntR family transcriptional regulator [Streptomyces varsoviensis]